MTKDNPKIFISFAIVNWNGGEILKQCLISIVQSCKNAYIRDYEIVLIDNGSNDLDDFFLKNIENLTLYKNSQNLGFSFGTNQSVKYANGEYLFILNNDVILFEDALKNLLTIITPNPSITCIAPALFYLDGRHQKSITGLPTLSNLFYLCFGLNKINSKYDTWMINNFDYTKRQQLRNHQPMFAALFISKKVWQEVGDLDLNFPILWNDTDWFKRFYETSNLCLYTPEIKLYHKHGFSVNRNRLKKVWLSTKGMYTYFQKAHSFNIPQKTLLLFLCCYQFGIRAILEGIKILIKK